MLVGDGVHMPCVGVKGTAEKHTCIQLAQRRACQLPKEGVVQQKT